jgi:hypothetical protein
MSTVYCEKNQHLYDPRKYSRCPYCPVDGLTGATIPGTQAAAVNRPNVPVTEPASPPRAAAPARPAAHGDRSGVPNKTVGIFLKRTGIDPVVGWLVCIEGANKGRDYRLHSDRNKVGRAPNMDVCIEGDGTISREDHCHIVFSPRSKTFNVIPGTGRNLIYLNGQDVFSAMPLAAYDRLDLGESSFLFLPFCSDRFDWGPAPSGNDVVERDKHGSTGGEQIVG